jgi:hypothetical protein
MARAYLKPREEYKRWLPPEVGLIPLRPEDDELEQGVQEFNYFWDLLKELPSFKKLEQGAKTGSLRRFSHDRSPGEGHMLFRPVGQEALASALGQLIATKKEDVKQLMKRVAKYDKEGGFQLDKPSSVWWMVLYDPNKKRMSVRGFKLAERLLVYLLGGGLHEHEEREKLRKELADARTIHVGDAGDERWRDHQGQAMDFNGRWVKPDKIELPPVIRA